MGTTQLKDSKDAKFYIKAILRNENNTEDSGKISLTAKEIQKAVAENKHIPEFSYELDILEIHQDKLLANAIKINGKLISFEHVHQKVKIDIWMVLPNAVPVVFEDVRAERLEDYDSTHPVYYSFSIDGNVKKINKRSAFRITVNLPCMITMGEHMGTVRGVLKDVSLTGFGVVVDSDLISNAIPNQSVMDVMFSDMKITNDPIKVSGLCVRKADLGGKIVYGAHCSRPPKEYKDYISAKQTARARAKEKEKENE